MNLYLTTDPLKDVTKFLKISDDHSTPPKEFGSDLYFEVSDGNSTVPFFLKHVNSIKTAVFYTKNIENFFNIFHFLRDEQFQVVSEGCSKTVEKDINKTRSLKALDELISHKINIKDHLNRELKKIFLPLTVEELNKSVERLAFPDVISNIKTSLFFPSAYLSQQTVAHKIINLLGTKKLSLKEIQREIGEETEKHLKSLLYFGVVKKKSGKFLLEIDKSLLIDF
ncbi:hypothetical protein CDIK_0514 [Cucumispora dikerogammari]|nr:hypothetical protein CDIK_0514 [Cucumispora dikerogammari]